MSGRVFVERAARTDLKSAYRWYEDREHGLGERFLLSVRSSFLEIGRNPEMFPVRFDSFRRVLMGNFPYAISYVIESDRIVVYSVTHTSRDPEALKRRLRGEEP